MWFWSTERHFKMIVRNLRHFVEEGTSGHVSLLLLSPSSPLTPPSPSSPLTPPSTSSPSLHLLPSPSLLPNFATSHLSCTRLMLHINRKISTEALFLLYTSPSFLPLRLLMPYIRLLLFSWPFPCHYNNTILQAMCIYSLLISYKYINTCLLCS